MNYQETLTYLYNSAPLFQQVGKDAYKEGLDNTYALLPSPSSQIPYDSRGRNQRERFLFAYIGCHSTGCRL